MAKKVIGFNDESDFERMAKSVRKSENMPAVGRQQRAKYPNGGGLKIRQAVISEKGNYNVHKILFKTPVFTGDLTTKPDETIIGETEAFVGEEFDYRIEVGDPVRVAKVNGQYWIVDAQQACRGYCIDDPPDQDYVYGWKLHAPPLTCCPEASGTHVLTTSDSGATYESSTFQCNGTGDNRKWIFNGSRLYISPMLDGGNVEYRTDQTVANCSIELLLFESAIFPDSDDCGKKQESVCLHPLCGTTSCTYCGDDAPLYLKASFGSSPTTIAGKVQYCTMDNPTVLEYETIGVSGSTNCVWKTLYTDVIPGTSYPGQMIITNGATPSLVYNSATYYLGAGESYDCWGVNVFEFDNYSSNSCEGHPQTITVVPLGGEGIEANCNQLRRNQISADNSSGTATVSNHSPFYLYFSVSGVTDNTCNECSKFNGDFIVSWDSKTFHSGDQISIGCSFGGGNYQWRIQQYMDVGAGESGVRLSAEDGAFDYVASYEYPNADEFWTSINGMRGPVEVTLDTNTTECATWPATITIYPIA